MPRRKRGDGKGTRSMTSLELESYWSWLPTFRVVAERESLHEASRLLQLSASSISRTIRLLETEIGASLFARAGGRLQLTPSGRDFLEFVRRSMRLVDDGASALRSPDVARPFRISIPRGLTALVAIPTIAHARAADPMACFYVSHEGDERAVVSGMIDLAVVCSTPQPSRVVQIHAIGELEVGVFCGRRHAMWATTNASSEDVMRHPFVTATGDLMESACWPPEHGRHVSVELGDMALLQEACVASLGLAVLPIAAARERVASRTLRRLASPTLARACLFALRRPPLGGSDRAQVVVETLVRVVGALASG